MDIKKLGSQGLTASQLGLGCMGMSEFYGEKNDAASLATLKHAYEQGVTFWDTADMYGPFLNEELVGKALKGIRKHITVATKFGILRDSANPSIRGFSGKPAYVKSSCEASLKRLNIEMIDLYYLHRVDPDTPIEETVGAMGQLVKEGKVRGIGLSEVADITLQKAHATFPVSAVQSEYSLFTRDPEQDILKTCKKLGIAFVPYSPLGRGFLTGQIKTPEDFGPTDYRRFSPRFQGENFTKNLQLVQKIEEMAKGKECTTAQLALAWVLNQGDFIFPIPGTKKIKYLDENIGAIKIHFTKAELAALDFIFTSDSVKGLRYPAQMMGSLNR